MDRLDLFQDRPWPARGFAQTGAKATTQTGRTPIRFKAPMQGAFPVGVSQKFSSPTGLARPLLKEERAVREGQSVNAKNSY